MGEEAGLAVDRASGLPLRVMDEDSVMESYAGARPEWKELLAKSGERLAEASSRHLPSGPKPDTIDLSTPPSKGEGMARDWTGDRASDKQINYLNSLLGESAKLQKQLKDHGVGGADALMSSTEEVVTKALKRIEEKTFTKGNAAQAIDFVIKMNKQLRDRLATFRDGSHTIVGREAGVVVDEDGMYRLPSGEIYKVQVAVHGSGRLYAKKLVIDEEAVWGPASPDGTGAAAIVRPARGHFEYEKGALRILRPEHKLGLDEAKDFGKLYGMCCVCAATLTAEQSIEEGIGPVCGKRVVERKPLFAVPPHVPAEATTQMELELRSELGLAASE